MNPQGRGNDATANRPAFVRGAAIRAMHMRVECLRAIPRVIG